MTRTRVMRAAAAALAAVLAVCLTPTSVSAQPQDPRAALPEAAVCPHTSVVLRNSYPPLRVDPEAGYPMWWLKGGAATQHLGLVVEADFPYAGWTSWSSYESRGTFAPVDVLGRADIAPDAGSTNPYVPGAAVMTPRRRFRILVVPDGTRGGTLPDGSQLAAGLRGIPNRLARSTETDWLLVERIYSPFPGYDRIGRGGPTGTPPPTATAVDLRTGSPLRCADGSALPSALVRPPAELGRVNDAIPALFALTNLDLFQRLDLRQFYPPKPDRRLVQFFRPGFASTPVPDLPSYPAADRCTGILAAKLEQDQIALIRVPKLPSFFDTTAVGAGTTYPAPDVQFVSFDNYGLDLGVQLNRGNPLNMGLSQKALRLDRTGGMTLVVWPRVGLASLPVSQALIFAKARANGWNLQKGNIDGPWFPNVEVIRYKGTNPDFRSSYTPNAATRGAPCFYDDPANAELPFERATAEYAVRPEHTGPATPQGVQCSLTEYLNDTCLRRLQRHIAETGGSYVAP